DREIVEERRLLGRAGAVMQKETSAAAPQFRNHGHDRRDANASGDQQMMSGLVSQREVVARHRGLDDVAGSDPLMPFARTLSFGLAQHGNAVTLMLGRVVPQREIAGRTVADPYRDMRPGREIWQSLLIPVRQLVAVDPLSEMGNRANAQQHAPRAQRAT